MKYLPRDEHRTAIRGLFDRAESAISKAHPHVRAGLGPTHWRSKVGLERVVRFQEVWGKPDEAAGYRAQPVTPDPAPVSIKGDPFNTLEF